MDDATLLSEIQEFFAATENEPLSEAQSNAFLKTASFVKNGAKKLPETVEKAQFALIERPVDRDEKAENALDTVSRGILSELTPHLQNVSWSRDALEGLMASFSEEKEVKFGKIAQPLRAALAGRMATPSVYDMMLVLGREETIARLAEAANA